MDFSFPYEPYLIQRQLMEVFYNALEQGKIAILESPTGTGKSLSTICTVLTWLETKTASETAEIERNTRILSENIRMADKDDDWMNAHGRKLKYQKLLFDVQEKAEYQKKIEERLLKAKNNVKSLRQKTLFLKKNKRQGVTDDDLTEQFPEASIKTKEEDIDNDLLPTDFNCDKNEEKCKKQSEKNEEKLQCTKIIYASRTHSQLEQFATEIQKTRFRPRILTLGARQLLCTNATVRELKNSALINDRCNELLNSKSTSKGKRSKVGKSVVASVAKCGCEYAKADAIEDLADQILTFNEEIIKTSRVSWLLEAGKKSTACPYFAARSALPMCELVLTPYNILLHNTARDIWNLDVKDNVVIIDEAHNLLQTVASIYSCELDEKRLSSCCSVIADYVERFSTRLSPRNLLYIRHLQTVTNRLLKVLRDDSMDGGTKHDGELVVAMPRFIAMLDCMDIDLFKLIDYLESSNLCRKLRDFNLRCTPKIIFHADEDKSEFRESKDTDRKTSRFSKFLHKSKNDDSEQKRSTINRPVETTSRVSVKGPQYPKSSAPFYQLKEFLQALTTRAEDARVLIQPAISLSEGRKYRFLLLNPAAKLKDIVAEARSFVLIGGTMKPVDQLLDAFHRACGVTTERIVQFSCGHIIDDSQLVALSVGKGPSKMDLRLSFSQRNDQTMLEIGRAFMNMLRHVPHGVVVFFPSYAFLRNFVHTIKTDGIFQQLNDIKPIYAESRGGSENETTATNETLDGIWLAFRKAATIGRGALLLAVIGGSLSEGINFSDELGRCVIVVGLPYANKNSLELRERMKYVQEKIGGESGAQLYESLCIHAVNQAIGRAIRHRYDHAAIILMDSRYLHKTINDQLPNWIQKRFVRCEMFHEALAKLISFFRNKK